MPTARYDEHTDIYKLLQLRSGTARRRLGKMEDRSKGVSEDRLRARKSGGLCLWATLRLQRVVRDRKQNLPNTDALNECWMLWNAMEPAPSKGLPYVYIRCDACG